MVNEAIAKRDQKMMEKGFAKGFVKGFAEGFAEGREEVRAKCSKEGIEQGMERGSENVFILSLKSLMENTGKSIEEVMELLSIPAKQRPHYAKLVLSL